MKYKIVFTDKAKSDLKELIFYIAKNFGEEKSREVLNLLYENISILELTPNIGIIPRIKTLISQGYKVLILEKNLVFYTVNEFEKVVNVERIISHKQDYKSIFKI